MYVCIYYCIKYISTCKHTTTYEYKKQLYANKKYIQNVTTCKQCYTEYHKVETLESLQSLSYWMRLCRFYSVNSSFSLYIT